MSELNKGKKHVSFMMRKQVRRKARKERQDLSSTGRESHVCHLLGKSLVNQNVLTISVRALLLLFPVAGIYRTVIGQRYCLLNFCRFLNSWTITEPRLGSLAERLLYKRI
jgi:hypothetical protein